MIKLILSDMDGTLLTPEGNLPKGFAEMMEKLHEKKVLFAPASGRQYYSLIKAFAPYKEDMLFLAENGTLIKDGKGNELYSDEIPKEAVKRVITELYAIGKKNIVLSGVNSAYITHAWDNCMDECTKYYAKSEFLNDLYDFESLDDKIIKIAVADIGIYRAEEDIYKPLMKALESDLQVVLSSNLWVDVMNKEAGKGHAVAYLRQKFNLQKDECAAFGDYLNDLTMMQEVYYSFAMENAHPDLKKVANFEAKSHAEYGVIQKINELMDKGLI